jgi:hypothetical protein
MDGGNGLSTIYPKTRTAMNLFLLALGACLMLAAAGYAQANIPRYTAGKGKVLLTRAVLIVVGIVFGLVSVATYPGGDALAVLVFLIAFGTVHAPAALILLLKGQGGARKS